MRSCTVRCWNICSGQSGYPHVTQRDVTVSVFYSVCRWSLLLVFLSNFYICHVCQLWKSVYTVVHTVYNIYVCLDVGLSLKSISYYLLSVQNLLFYVLYTLSIVYILYLKLVYLLSSLTFLTRSNQYDLKIVLWQNAHNYAALTIFVPSARTIWFGWSGMRYGMVLSFSPLHHSRSNFKTQQEILKYTTSADVKIFSWPFLDSECWVFYQQNHQI